VHILDKMLKKGASVNAKDVNLETPLHQGNPHGHYHKQIL
jgi:ankyrin repeat protein